MTRALAPGGLLAISTGIDRAHGAAKNRFVIGRDIEDVLQEALAQGLRPVDAALVRKKTVWLLEKAAT